MALPYARTSAASRGYGVRWRAFRSFFISLLVQAGIAPVCGAALPDGPRTNDSRCATLGLLVFASEDGTSLHFDHEPPLQDNERTNPAAVCDETRIQLLCASCHAMKDGPRKAAAWAQARRSEETSEETTGGEATRQAPVYAGPPQGLSTRKFDFKRFPGWEPSDVPRRGRRDGREG